MNRLSKKIVFHLSKLMRSFHLFQLRPIGLIRLACSAEASWQKWRHVIPRLLALGISGHLPRFIGATWKAGCLAFISLLWFGVVVIRAADTHYVSLNGTNDAAGGYTNWPGAATNIQWAVNAAVAGDTVLVSNGTYNLTNMISIAAAITVRSFTEQGHGTNDTIVDGGYPDRSNQCFYMTAGTLNGLTIRNGCATNTINWYGGGGVFAHGIVNVLNCYIYGNSQTNNAQTYAGGGGIMLDNYCTGSIVSNCTIVSNTVYGVSGGGIAMWAGLIVASRISGNWATYNAGVHLAGGIISNCTVDNNAGLCNNFSDVGIGTQSGALITDCVISNNVSYTYGGGVYLYGPNTTMRNSTITANKANDTGGGVKINCWNGPTFMSNCLVTANISSNSGAGGVYMYNPGSGNVIANCTIARNTAQSGGAGLYVDTSGYSQLVQNCLIYGNTNLGANGGGVRLNSIGQYPYGLINCTIVSNQSGTLGGGLYTTTTNNYIANCIVYGNVTTNDVFDEVYVNTAGGTNNFWYNCTPTNLVLGQGNTTNNPQFVDQANRNYHLSANSPCVNTGTNQIWMTGAFDLDGRIRIRYGTVDMGTYEAIYSGTIFTIR
ncbi:MAG: right-handed parallel beta-helix repeat-containing protein [Kiritimatiellae bacterium]|nr:right-handed parallel beta-helix repeat-containing protein [Kiritimatiellia bacterium]